MKEIICAGHTPADCYDDDTFYGVDKQTSILKVPKGSTHAYKNKDVWKNFMNIREIDTTNVDKIIDSTISNDAFVTEDGVTARIDNSMITIYFIDGRMAVQRLLNAGESISLNPGCYIVVCTGKNTKVII